MPRHHGRLNRQVQVSRWSSKSAEKSGTKFTASDQPNRPSMTLPACWAGIAALSAARSQSWPRPTQLSRRAGLHSRNAKHVDAKIWSDVNFYLGLQWSPEQIADKVAFSQESVYLHVYVNKAAGGDCTRTCAAKSPGANAICADVTGADRSLTAARSVSGQAPLKSASR